MLSSRCKQALVCLDWCLVWVNDLPAVQHGSPLHLAMRLPSAGFCSKRGAGIHPSEVCSAMGLHHYYGHQFGHRGIQLKGERERKNRVENEG